MAGRSCLLGSVGVCGLRLRRVSGPVGGTFFQEGRDALVCLRVQHVLHDDVASEGVGLLGGHLRLGVERRFAVAHGGGEFCRDGVCECLGVGGKVVSGCGFGDEAEGLGLVGCDEAACGEHLEGRLARDGPRERNHRRRAEQADVDPVDPEFCVCRCHRHVAGGHKLAACCSGDAVHLRDNRLGQGLDTVHEGRTAVEEVLERGRSAVFGLPFALHFLKVVACAEGFAFAREDNRPDGVVICDCVESRVKRCDHGVAEGIQPRGRCHCQMCDMIRIGSPEEGHGLAFAARFGERLAAAQR